MKLFNLQHVPVSEANKTSGDRPPSGSNTSARLRARPASGSVTHREKTREKTVSMQRPQTSGSQNSSTSSLNGRPPARDGKTRRGADTHGRGRDGSNTAGLGLGPREAFNSNGAGRPSTLPSNSWAVTQLCHQQEGDDADSSDEEKEKTRHLPHPDEKKPKGPTGGRKILSKSEREANETLRVWLEGPKVDSDEFDTDLEDDFPPEPSPLLDYSGKYIYEKQCLRAGLVPVSYLVRNLEQGSLRMRYHYLGGTGAKPLAHALKENTLIEEIDLSDNYIEGAGAKALAEVLKDNMFIVNLNISNNFIRSIGSGALCDMLELNTTLKTLTLRGNQLCDKDAIKLAEAMRNNQSLVSLDLSYNNFGEDGGILLAQGLAANIALADLDLSWNSITRKGGVQMAKALVKNQSLEILDLSWNGISNTGAAAFGVTLKTNKTLKVLDISNNRIGEEGAKKLGPGIGKNQGLETLLMGMNPIKDQGVMSVLKGVSTCMSLRLVGIEDILMAQPCQDKIKEITSSRDILIMYSTGAPTSNRINETILTVFERFINENADRMEDLFLQMDKDKSGDITLEEFKFGLKDFGIRLTNKQLDQLLEELDADKSGTIELQELLDGTVMVQQERAKQAVRARDEKLLQEGLQTSAREEQVVV